MKKAILGLAISILMSSTAWALQAETPNPCVAITAVDDNTNETLTLLNISGTTAACPTAQNIDLSQGATLVFSSNESIGNLAVWGFAGLSWPSNTELSGSHQRYQYTYAFSAGSAQTSLPPDSSTNIIFSASDDAMQLSDVALYTGSNVSATGQIQLTNANSGAPIPSNADIHIVGDHYLADISGSALQSGNSFLLNFVPAMSNYTITASYSQGGVSYSIPVSPSTVAVSAGKTVAAALNYQPLAPAVMHFMMPTQPSDANIQSEVKIKIADQNGQTNTLLAGWGSSPTFALTRGDTYQFSIEPVAGNGEIYQFNFEYPSVTANNDAYNNTITPQAVAAATGEEALTVSGLPQGQYAEVDYTANNQTDSYPGLGNGSTEIDLPVGQYSVVANSLNVSDQTYQPVLSPSEVSIAAGQNNPSLSVNYVRQVPYRPYVDMTLESGGSTPLTDINAYSQAASIHQFTLAFIASAGSSSCTPAWGGVASLEVGNGQVQAQLATARQNGLSYVISMGGYTADTNNQDLSQTCTDVSSLAQAYESLIKTYQPIGLDFDIEGDLINQPLAYNRMMSAIAQVQQAYPNVAISFTLPVMPTGLLANGQDVVIAAKNAGIQNFKVNLMAMDYGSKTDFPGDMGQYAIQAATAVQQFMQAQYPSTPAATLWGQIAVTPMIGLNDPPDSNPSDVLQFTLQNAQALQQFAAQHQLGGLAVWSLNRDHPCSGSDNNANLCSGMQTVNGQVYTVPMQKNPFDYTKALSQ